MALDTTASSRPEHLRVGNSERQAAAEDLQSHYADGRLSWEELDERLALAWAARTQADLRPLFTDLPRLDQPLSAAAPTDRGRRTPRDLDLRLPFGGDVRMLVWLLVVVAVTAGLVAATDGFILVPAAFLWVRFGRRQYRRHHDCRS